MVVHSHLIEAMIVDVAADPHYEDHSRTPNLRSYKLIAARVNDRQAARGDGFAQFTRR